MINKLFSVDFADCIDEAAPVPPHTVCFFHLASGENSIGDRFVISVKVCEPEV